MKKVCVSALLCAALLVWCAPSAQALPPINVQWQQKYSALAGEVEKLKSPEDEGVLYRCNVCHFPGASKKEKNTYGLAVGKHITKAQIMKIKEDAGDDFEKGTADTTKYIIAGLAAAEAETAANGQTYGAIIKSGKLPGGSERRP